MIYCHYDNVIIIIVVVIISTKAVVIATVIVIAMGNERLPLFFFKMVSYQDTHERKRVTSGSVACPVRRKH